MALTLHFSALIFFLLTGLAASSVFISDGAFGSHGSTGRNLLQAKKSCSVDFESADYTPVLSKCKGPQYAVTPCCGALKEFACPYADAINDLTTNCADSMFSYLNLHGNYPAGLFANECKEGKEGLACPAEAPAPTTDKSACSSTYGANILFTVFLLLVVTVGFHAVPFQLF